MMMSSENICHILLSLTLYVLLTLFFDNAGTEQLRTLAMFVSYALKHREKGKGKEKEKTKKTNRRLKCFKFRTITGRCQVTSWQ